MKTQKWCSAVLSMYFVVLGISVAAPTEPRELLEYLITQNEAARAKIKSFSCTLDITYKGRPYTAQLKRKGNCVWLFNHSSFSSSAGIDDLEHRMIVNGQYMAEYRFQSPQIAMNYAYWRDYASFETMGSEIQRRIQSQRPDDFFEYCFGTPRGSFRQSRTQRPEIRWDAVQTENDDGRTVYQIRRFYGTSNLQGPDAVWVIDPNKGFLATETFAYSAGKVWLHRSMQVKQVTPGVWFPVSFQQENYGRGVESRQILERWEKVIARDLEVNIDIPNEQFEIDALNLAEDAPNVIVLRTLIDGSKVPYVYDANGDLVPQHPPGARRP